MKCAELIKALVYWAPLELQENYDNSGLILGNPNAEINKVLVSLDCTEAVVDEAIRKGCNFIVSHHPLIFSGIKKLTGKNDNERAIIKAISSEINIYAIHTNLDHVSTGVNAEISKRLGLVNSRILRPISSTLVKLVTFVPEMFAEKVRAAMFDAGAGNIGNYSHCSFNTKGVGTYQAGIGANPFAGQIGNIHNEPEIRIELVLESWKLRDTLNALKSNHPYEEVAYDVFQLNNSSSDFGSGMIGEWEKPKNLRDALETVKNIFGGLIRYTHSDKDILINKVALCGGSGSFLINDAQKHGAHLFITSDIKYHQFFDLNPNFVLFDIGHHENEQFTVDLIFRFLKEKFPTFAAQISEVNTNPIHYF